MKINKKITAYLKGFNLWVYFILILCGLGLFRNTVFLKAFHPLGQEVDSIFLAMIMLYFAQIVLIFMRRWIVWIISLIQVIFCIYVYPDFSILPLSAVMKFVFFEGLIERSYAWANFINFMFISFGFSVEILKTYLLYIYFPRSKKQKLENN